MGKTLLNEKNANLLLLRAKALSSDSTGSWGSMSVTDMLYHCNTINNAILQGKKTGQKPTLKQRLLKILALRLLRQFPKGVNTNPKFLRSENDQIAFSEEQKRFAETLLRFANYTDDITGKHPLFGSLNTKEWRRFVWMHTDHHLRQFGV